MKDDFTWRYGQRTLNKQHHVQECKGGWLLFRRLLLEVIFGLSPESALKKKKKCGKEHSRWRGEQVPQLPAEDKPGEVTECKGDLSS